MFKKIISIIFLLNCPSVFSQTIPAYVPSNGLIGWWPFNGNGNDESGNGHHATVSGAILTSDRYGNNNSAYNCSSGYLSTTSTNGIPRNGPLSISVWFNAAGDFIIGEFICLGNTYNTTWGAVGGNNAFTMNYGRGCNSTGSSLQNINISYNNWHHVVYVSSGLNGHCDVYYDGSFFGTSVTANSNGLCSSTKLYFGIDIYSGYGLENYNGSLDDIGIWDRALTPCEIIGLFLASKPGSITNQPNNQTYHVGENVQLTVTSSDPLATFQWQIKVGNSFQNIYNGGQYSGTTNDTLTILNVTENNSGIYRCIVTSANCPEISNTAILNIIEEDIDVYIEMPNVFTPNNDGVNDNFIPVKYKGVTDATLHIFNRWGVEIYSTSSFVKGWNGYYNGQPCSDGTYFWLIKYSINETEVKELKGVLTLLK